MEKIEYRVREFETRRPFKLAIALPCHIRDLEVLETYCLPSIMRLDPRPDLLVIQLNDGHEEGLKGLRVELFDKVFYELGAKVLFSYGVDGYFFKGLMSHAREDMVVSVPWIPRRPLTILSRLIIDSVRGRGWTGAYFMPEQVWNQIRDQFNGDDSDIHQAVSRERKRGTLCHYHWVKTPQLFQVRLRRQSYLRAIRENDYSRSQKIIKLLEMFDF